MSKLLVIDRSEIAKIAFVMTKSMHVPFSGSFELGRVISETREYYFNLFCVMTQMLIVQVNWNEINLVKI